MEKTNNKHEPIKLAVDNEDLFDLNEDNVDRFIAAVKEFFKGRERYGLYNKIGDDGLFRCFDLENPQLFLGIEKLELDGKVCGVSLDSTILGDARMLKGIYPSSKVCSSLSFSKLPKVAFIDDDKLYLSIGSDFLGPFRKREKSLYRIITE